MNSRSPIPYSPSLVPLIKGLRRRETFVIKPRGIRAESNVRMLASTRKEYFSNGQPETASVREADVWTEAVCALL